MLELDKINDGGPAYPHSFEDAAGLKYWRQSQGVSLRDLIAIKALAGLCANPGGPYQANEMSGWGIVNCTVDDVAAEAYRLSDAMLRARSHP